MKCYCNIATAQGRCGCDSVETKSNACCVAIADCRWTEGWIQQQNAVTAVISQQANLVEKALTVPGITVGQLLAVNDSAEQVLRRLCCLQKTSLDALCCTQSGCSEVPGN